MKTQYDVIVAGAGPAGAAAAYKLARSGVEVLLIEKNKMPRYKCCAGGITDKTAKLLPFDIRQIAEDSITDINVTSRKAGSYHGHYDENVIYTVTRSTFDSELAKRAGDAGSSIVEGQSVLAVHHNTDGVEVVLPRGKIHSKFIIGADGAHSIIAESSGFYNTYSYIAGINAEIHVTEEVLRQYKSTILVDVDCIPGGYGWIFPRSNCLAVGIATIFKEARNLRSQFLEFTASLNLGEFNIIRQQGGLIPIVNGDPRVTEKRAALIGDAAGLADPLSGEGIYNALISAELASAAVKKSLDNSRSDLNEYQDSFNRVLMPEIKIARILQKIFLHFPEVTVKLLNFDERVWKACCYYALGKIDYVTAREKVGGFSGVRNLLKKVMK